MLNITFHSREFKFRIFYCFLSLFFTFGCIYPLFEDIVMALTPAIPTYCVYSSMIEVIATKVALSAALAWWLVLPHMLTTLWLFLRPGLREYESDKGPKVSTLVITIVVPWIVYSITLDFVAWILQNLSSYYFRFLPTLSGSTSFITTMISISVIVTILPRVIIRMIGAWEKKFKKFRLVAAYVATGLAAWILPPDIIYLVVAATLTVTVLEGLYFFHLLRKFYLSSYLSFNLSESLESK